MIQLARYAGAFEARDLAKDTALDGRLNALQMIAHGEPLPPATTSPGVAVTLGDQPCPVPAEEAGHGHTNQASLAQTQGAEQNATSLSKAQEKAQVPVLDWYKEGCTDDISTASDSHSSRHTGGSSNFYKTNGTSSLSSRSNSAADRLSSVVPRGSSNCVSQFNSGMMDSPEMQSTQVGLEQPRRSSKLMTWQRTQSAVARGLIQL